MNLLIVTGIFPPDVGGPASYVPKIAAELLRRGHSLEVLSLSDDLRRHDEAYPFRVHRIRRRLFKPWRILRTILKVWRLCRDKELIYVNGLDFECAIAAQLRRCPAVHKVVGNLAWEIARNRGWFRGTLDEYYRHKWHPALCLLDWWGGMPLRLADKIIVPSQYLARIVRGLGVAAEKIQIIFNAVEPPKMDLIFKLPPFEGTTLVTACRLVPWKGVHALIEAVARLPRTRLVVAGDGPLRRELEELAAKRGAQVLFLGQVAQHEIAGCLRASDVFILNSSYEGLPHIVLEAMAVGIPVIATNAGGTGEVVAHQQTGLLIGVGDDDALEQAIVTLSADRELRSRLCEEAARQLEKAFRFEGMADSVEAVLQQHARSVGKACVAPPCTKAAA